MLSGTVDLAGPSGGAEHLEGSGDIENYGTINQTGAATFMIDDSTTLDNDHPFYNGTYDFHADASISYDAGHSPGTFINDSLLEKTAGTGISTIGINFFNTVTTVATIEVQTGTIELRPTGGANKGGIFEVAPGATLDLTGGTSVSYTGGYTGLPPVPSGGYGTISLNSGTLEVGSGGASFNFPGTMFQWTGGSINLAGSLANTGP